MTFEEIKREALARWECIEQDGIPVIRVGTATSDRASGALEVVEEFEKELARLNVEAKVIQTGSVGFCNYEPLVIISKPDYPRICYNNVTSDMVPVWLKDFS